MSVTCPCLRRAVADFAYGPVPGGSADYTIRVSLLETPETWIPVDKFNHWTSRCNTTTWGIEPSML